MKLSLCMIAKPTESEGRLLDRCLEGLKGNVDEMCVTITKGSGTRKGRKFVEKICKKYGARVSYFDWIKDFSAARNFNFSQAKGDFIFWVDCDDLVKGAEGLKSLAELMEKKHIDAAVMDYLYDFEGKKCTVKHLKTRVVRKDSVEWVGEVHEDFNALREIESFFCKDIKILHLSNDYRAKHAAERNLEITKDVLLKKPDDPRSLYLMANALMGVGKESQAKRFFAKFIKQTGSEEEKYIAYINLFVLTKKEIYALRAVAIRPTYPDAYFKLAEFNYDNRKFDLARDFVEIGLQLPVPDMSIIVHNPRDYDYNPLMLLMKISLERGKYTHAFKVLQTLEKNYPKDKTVRMYKRILAKERNLLFDADKAIEKAEKMKGKKLKEFLKKLPNDIASHPKICILRNRNFIKKKSTGRDLVYYCGYTSRVWNPQIAEEKGVGGSEEAVINLSKRWVKMGWNVIVYNNCGEAKDYDGVHYKPFWAFNVKDKQDIIILWRQARLVEHNLNATKIFVDLHDVMDMGEFSGERLRKIDRVFVKSHAHRILFPNIPDEKIGIIPNGVDVLQFDQTITRNPYLILNTSSPDRHLDATLDVFERLIYVDPSKPWKLAWYYGWDVYDEVHSQDSRMLGWKKEQVARFDKLKEQGRAEGGGMISHEEIAKLHLKAGIFLYPTQFYEIFCMSVIKAQLADQRLICSDFAALAETAKYGQKIHTDGKLWKNSPFLGDRENAGKYVKQILLNQESPHEQVEWAKKYSWENISEMWNNLIT
ncbi:MAG: glycosyltransferase [Patescibacteria group bacterium]|nr:glycosyltransferase [Patescibacteria group bacterium]